LVLFSYINSFIFIIIVIEFSFKAKRITKVVRHYTRSPPELAMGIGENLYTMELLSHFSIFIILVTILQSSAAWKEKI
jgi:hypothetical protein